VTPGRLPASLRQLSPTSRSRRLKTTGQASADRSLTPKDAPASILETEASKCRGGPGRKEFEPPRDPVEAVIADGGEMPVYLKIADNAKHLRELGMSDRAIARALGVSDKTIAKAAVRPGLSPR